MELTGARITRPQATGPLQRAPAAHPRPFGGAEPDLFPRCIVVWM